MVGKVERLLRQDLLIIGLLLSLLVSLWNVSSYSLLVLSQNVLE